MISMHLCLASLQASHKNLVGHYENRDLDQIGIESDSAGLFSVVDGGVGWAAVPA